MTHRIVCAVKGGCAHADGDAALTQAYGAADAALVRANAPNLVYEPGEPQLPIDWRRCRRTKCAEALDDQDLDVHTTHAGERATAFTRLIRRDGRTYIQYWLYYPDSNTTIAGSDKLWEWSWIAPRLRELISGDSRYPGFHEDDWESVHIRLDPDGDAWVRASSHGAFQGCKQRRCRNEWTQSTGWSRVSRGSHAGHIPLETTSRHGRGPGPGDARHQPLYPGRDLRERTTTGEGLRLIPLETLDRDAYRPLDEGIKPPWGKEVYDRPESDKS